MAVDVLITRFASVGSGKLIADLNTVSGAIGRVETQSQRMSRIGNNISLAGAAGVFALAKLGQGSIKAASDMQATQVAFETLTGNATVAKGLYKDIQKFSLLSPFNNADVAKSSIALLGTGIAADKVIPRLHAVGNAVASIGGDTEKFNGVSTILNKMQLRAKVSSVQLNQLALRGINPYKILQEELGLTADQVANIGHTGITGAVAVEALARGFDKIGGGQAMERLNKTYAGQVGQLEDATDQLQASLGALILPDATKFVSGLAGIAQHLKDISETSPGLTKAGLAIAFGGSVALIAGGQYLKFQQILKTTAAAKLALKAATEKDIIAETAKTGVATREAAAIAASGNAATGTAGKLGMLSRLKMFGGSALSMGGTSVATSSAFGGGRGALGALGNLGATGGARSMGLVTNAGAGASIGLGVIAGVSASNNMQAAGYSQGQSYMYGAATGIGAAGAAMFLPGGAVAVVIGEAAAFGINKLYNEPMEAAALKGTGAEGDLLARQNDANRGVSRGEAGSREKLAAVYDEMAAQAKDAGDSLQALSYETQAANQRTRAQKEAANPALAAARAQAAGLRVAASAEAQKTPAQREAELRASQAEQKKYWADAEASVRAQYATGQLSGNGRDDVIDPRAGAIQSRRDGSRSVTIHLPETRGDGMARRMNYNTRTPAPRYVN